MQVSKDNIDNKTLSIRISTDGFCFCRYAPSLPDSLKYSFYKPDRALTLAANLQRGIEACPFIIAGESYSVKAIIETDEFITLPAEYDDKPQYKHYHRYAFPNKDARVEIFSNRLNAQGMTVIFPVEKSLCANLQSLGDVAYYAPVSIFMGLLTRMEIPQQRYMLACFQGDMSLYIAVDNGKVQLTNCFKESGDDSVYYLLSIWKELGLSQTEDMLYICGDRCVEERLLLISRFIKNCKRMNGNSLFAANLLNRMEGIPFDLMALMLCE